MRSNTVKRAKAEAVNRDYQPWLIERARLFARWTLGTGKETRSAIDRMSPATSSISAVRKSSEMCCPISDARTRSSRGKCRPEHGQAANGRFLCRFVLDDVPVLGKSAVLEAHDIHHDPVRRQAHA